MKAILFALFSFFLSLGLQAEALLEKQTKLARGGDAKAQYNLGLMYAKGEGVPEDDKEAVKWYTKAAEQGHASAQLNLRISSMNVSFRKQKQNSQASRQTATKNEVDPLG